MRWHREFRPHASYFAWGFFVESTRDLRRTERGITMERIIHGDVLSPILAYMRLNGKHKVILESIPREKENARFSILAYNPVFEIKFENGVLYQNGQVIDRDPLDFLYEVTHKSQHHSDLPFGGGAIGFVGYDMISLYEEIGQLPEDTIGTPDMHFFVYESYMVFDHKKEKIHIIEDALYSNRSNEELEAALDQVLEELKIPAPNEFEDLDVSPLQFRPHISPQKFEEMVETARDLIRNGDMFQCVLSQRFSAEVTGNPFDFYRNLRVTNPSNYLYFYDFGDYQIIGASPESLVSVKNGIVTTNPIAGTRPRGANDEEDEALASDLLSDEKETAEHRMLVDLGRNDIGRIAETASVQVTKYMEVELFRYVMHLTSVVKGRLLPELTAMDALKATLPAGTVSGAPKIRAMKRIYELETEKRGIYAGAIGYLSATGDMDFAIAIRTMILKNKTAYVQAGAGIVYDSIAQNEYQETINKAKSMTRTMILLIDNYDSFTYNLAQYIGNFAEVQVLRNDDSNLYEEATKADGLVFSPGPGWPADAGKMEEMIRDFAGKKPILGICLGHQAIAEVFGGKLGLAPKVMHGKQSQIRFETPSVLYQGIEDNRPVMRYHSILIEEMPEEFEVTARSTDDQAIMGIQHKTLPIYGLQYHPESIGTPDGLSSIQNFIEKVVK